MSCYRNIYSNLKNAFEIRAQAKSNYDDRINEYYRHPSVQRHAQAVPESFVVYHYTTMDKEDPSCVRLHNAALDARRELIQARKENSIPRILAAQIKDCLGLG